MRLDKVTLDKQNENVRGPEGSHRKRSSLLTEEEEYEQVIIRNATHLHSFENAYHDKTPWYEDKNSRKVVMMGTLTIIFCFAELVIGIIVLFKTFKSLFSLFL
jgi:hypothetical protein